MNRFALAFLCMVVSGTVLAEINERTGPDPGTQAKINSVIAQAWATGKPPVDTTTIATNAQSGTEGGINLDLSVGTVNTSAGGQAPRENNVVTGDNTLICYRCN